MSPVGAFSLVIPYCSYASECSQTVDRGGNKVLGFMHAMLAPAPPSSLWGMYLTKVLSLVNQRRIQPSPRRSITKRTTVLTIYTSAVARHQPIPELSHPPPSGNLNAFLLGPPRPNHGSFKAARSLGSYTGTRKCNQVAQWELEGELDTYYCGATPPDRRNGHGSWATPGAGKAGPLTSSAVPSCASFPDSVALEK